MAHLIAKRRQESKERHVKPHPVTGKLETTYDPVPPDACQYGKASFWDGRYGTAPEAFDWYHPYDAISGIIEKYIEPGQKVINLGCGNSTLTEEMYADGYDNIWNIDLSRVAIDLVRTVSLPASSRVPGRTFVTLLRVRAADELKVCGYLALRYLVQAGESDNGRISGKRSSAAAPPFAAADCLTGATTLKVQVS